MTRDEALLIALEALKQIDEAMPFPVAKLAQAAIKEALAQSEQEQWVCECGADSYLACKCVIKSTPHLKPLTDEEIDDVYSKANCDYISIQDSYLFARAIEAAHGIKENI